MEAPVGSIVIFWNVSSALLNNNKTSIAFKIKIKIR
jgi:hypothetical protein